MASEDESQAFDITHDEKDWDAQKENFRKCYIDHNMTRKDAAQYMKDHFDFDATPRQWERKIKQWGFTKYSSRDDRLQQIAQTGKSIFDIGRPGRRPRARTDEHGNLHPHDDRNLRRFARREVSRSRSRSRSQSFTGRSTPNIKDEHQPGPSNTVTDQTYNLKLSNPALLHPPSSGGFNIAATPASGDQDEPIQLHYLREENPPAASEANEPEILLTVDNSEEWPQTQLSDLAAQFDLGDGPDQYQAFADDILLTQGLVGDDLQNPNPQYSLDPNDPSLSYPISGHTMSISTGFDHFAVSGNGMETNPGVLSDNILPDQQIFGTGPQIQPAPNALDSMNLNLPIITFDVVEPDPTMMLPPPETLPFPNLPDMPEPGPDLSVSDNGPLHSDVMPLVDEYTRAVHSTALWSLGHQQYGDQFAENLAASLDQPGQVFKAKMAVVLENFAKSQQRAFQSMRDTCSKLRQKNAVLEQMLKEESRRDMGQSAAAGPHRSSLPVQASVYDNIYSPNY
ncbi:hypothetical protein A1O3_04316 [Capronia epimyces CBS 606.96]|uniref:Clr5 domain-containing protein n=1 Tax=Capronia epimyces CBS 606.96 TaxID=1182542 RepID=W9Y3J6_9EURO|nr:uncharacterized protein A1O3_04316 [Capronia epimyces CBS 606.96]EXJ87357.1 hypothetical protein A1O3_04316 [Capronia epimyces CBS 606.96]